MTQAVVLHHGFVRIVRRAQVLQHDQSLAPLAPVAASHELEDDFDAVRRAEEPSAHVGDLDELRHGVGGVSYTLAVRPRVPHSVADQSKHRAERARRGQQGQVVVVQRQGQQRRGGVAAHFHVATPVRNVDDGAEHVRAKRLDGIVSVQGLQIVRLAAVRTRQHVAGARRLVARAGPPARLDLHADERRSRPAHEALQKPPSSNAGRPQTPKTRGGARHAETAAV
mmetsp:Transcript_20290/g.69966  ORF Transcript_20290/g.69966 Transcript_20290/m.69966 type:complete len:225 (+) Transcript_20290:1420-2094(+)